MKNMININEAINETMIGDIIYSDNENNEMWHNA